MFSKCECPKCGKTLKPMDYDYPIIEECDGEVFYRTFTIQHECGCNFDYEEEYILNSSRTKILD